MQVTTSHNGPTSHRVTREDYISFRRLQNRQWEFERVQRLSARLRAITTGCRADMHEPDNNGLSAVVTGSELDNAMGDCAPADACGEYIVTITDAGGNVEHFSLANLIALARVADVRQFLTDGDF